MPHEPSAIIDDNHQGSVRSRGNPLQGEKSRLPGSSKSVFRLKIYAAPAIIEKRDLRIDLMKDSQKSAD